MVNTESKSNQIISLFSGLKTYQALFKRLRLQKQTFNTKDYNAVTCKADNEQ